jgi:hypothetical protein
MEMRLFPTILLGQLIERLDDLALRSQGISHTTSKTLADIAESMENQQRIIDMSDPDQRTEIVLTNEQWAVLDKMRDGSTP